MATEPKRSTKPDESEDTRTDEEILKELGIAENSLVLDLDSSAEDIATKLAKRVRADLEAQGWSPEDAHLSDEENPDEEDQEEEEQRTPNKGPNVAR